MYEQMVVAVQTTFSGDIVALYQHIDRTVDRWVLINLVLMLLIVWGMPSTRRLFARRLDSTGPTHLELRKNRTGCCCPGFDIRRLALTLDGRLSWQPCCVPRSFS